MRKKLIAASMSVAAITVFATAPAASASPVLTQNGAAVPLGSEVIWANTGNVQFTSQFTVECNTANLKGTVTKNNGTKFTMEVPASNIAFTGTGTAGDCTSPAGGTKMVMNSSLCLETNGGTDTLIVTGCGGATVTFTRTTTSLAPCKYGSNSLTGTFNTNADATFSFTEQPAKLVEGGFTCPTTWNLDMDFDLTTPGSVTLFVS